MKLKMGNNPISKTDKIEYNLLTVDCSQRSYDKYDAQRKPVVYIHAWSDETVCEECPRTGTWYPLHEEGFSGFCEEHFFDAHDVIIKVPKRCKLTVLKKKDTYSNLE